MIVGGRAAASPGGPSTDGFDAVMADCTARFVGKGGQEATVRVSIPPTGGGGRATRAAGPGGQNRQSNCVPPTLLAAREAT